MKWTDGAPLVARRAMGRGEAWVVTLPFSVDESDLALRPAFLALLDAWVQAARERAAPKRSDVGTPWRFPGAHSVEAQGPDGRLAATRDEGVVRLVPPLAGAYRITVDGKAEARVAAPDPARARLPASAGRTVDGRRGNGRTARRGGRQRADRAGPSRARRGRDCAARMVAAQGRSGLT